MFLNLIDHMKWSLIRLVELVWVAISTKQMCCSCEVFFSCIVYSHQVFRKCGSVRAPIKVYVGFFFPFSFFMPLVWKVKTLFFSLASHVNKRTLWRFYGWGCLAQKEKVYGVWRPIWAACRWILKPVCYFPNSTCLQSKMLLTLTTSNKLVRGRVETL